MGLTRRTARQYSISRKTQDENEINNKYDENFFRLSVCMCACIERLRELNCRGTQYGGSWKDTRDSHYID